MREGILLKKYISAFFLCFVCVFFFSACNDAVSPVAVAADKTALISLLEDFENIPQTLDQATLVSAYTVIRDNPAATQKDVNEAIVGLKALKETIFSTPMSFIDGGLEPHVRRALGFEEDKVITIGNCYALEELDCTYNEAIAPKIRVGYDFRYFPNLKSLNLSGNNLQDLGGFAYLSKLETLSLAYNPAKTSGLASNDSQEVRSLDILGRLPLKTLDMSGQGVFTGVDSLPVIKTLETLTISGNTVESFDNLAAKTPELKSLTAADCVIVSFSGLSHCTTLTGLDFSRTALTDMSFLTTLTQLNSLTLDGAVLSDFSSLTKVPHLVTLSLSGCGISDIAWLSGFTDLESLNLSSNSISDVSMLKGKTGIRYLNLSGNQISAFVLTDAWSAVEELDLSRNGILSFDVSITGDCALTVLNLSANAVNSVKLGEVNHLQTLDLTSNALTDLNLMSDTLVTLSLSDNPLNSLLLNLPALGSLELACNTQYEGAVVLNLPALKRLDLSKEFTASSDLLTSLIGIETLSVHLSGVSADSVAKLTSLKTLTVYGGDDASLRTLGQLPMLESLTVIGSAVTTPALSGNRTLKSLVFESCASLSDLSSIVNLPALETLSITGGKAESPVVSGFPALRALTLSGCGVKVLTGLSDLPALTSLSLPNNGLQTVSVFGFSRLQYLDLSNNKITNQNAIATDLTMGTLDISGNDKGLYEDLSVFPDSIKIITSH